MGERPREGEQVLHHGPVDEGLDLDRAESQALGAQPRQDVDHMGARANQDRDRRRRSALGHRRLERRFREPRDLACLAVGVAVEYIEMVKWGHDALRHAQPVQQAALMLLALQHGLPVEELGAVEGDRLVIELIGAGATGASEERGSRIADALEVPIADLRHAWDHGLARALGWEG